MKRTILGFIILGVLGGVAIYAGNHSATEVYNSSNYSTTTVEVVPEWADDEDAVKAAQAVIRKKELEAELEQLEVENQMLEERITEIEKELGTYWKSTSNIKAHIRSVFPEDSQTAIAIAHCESGLKPNAYNPSNNDGSTDGGLWQINSVHDKRLQQLGLDKYNPEDATAYARILYDERGGWEDWVCYWKNMHIAYLN